MLTNPKSSIFLVLNSVIFFVSVNRSMDMSESDTDSDVLFENQSKPNGILRNNGLTKNGRKNYYATTRLGRRIKA